MENNSGGFPDMSNIKTAAYVFTVKEWSYMYMYVYKKLLTKQI